eukprot:s4528_g7.t1
METYIARHKDEDLEQVLEDIRTSISFECADPRLQLRRRAAVEKLTEKAERRLQEDWDRMDKIMEDYIKEHKKLPYCSILQSMAISFLGAGVPVHEVVDMGPPLALTEHNVIYNNLGGQGPGHLDDPWELRFADTAETDPTNHRGSRGQRVDVAPWR